MTSSSGMRFPLDAKDYELLEEVGDGVDATVYRARCIPLDEIVAIKIWDLEKSWNDAEKRRKEIHLMSLVDHPNLLSAYCCFLDGSSLWIVTPYMPGGSCLNIMKSVYPEGFEQPVIATLLWEVLKALVCLHGQGYIHRDIKAGNVLVGSKGTIKLGDLGVLSTNTFFGTPSWMAPEVRKQVEGADIWSFGVTALEFAHGHAPFSKHPPMKVLLMTLQNDYEKDKKFTKSFGELVAACLVKDPKNRPTAAELLNHPFFKHARSTEYLSSTILDGLSPLGERYRNLKEEKAKLLEGIDSNKEILSQQEYLRGISAWNFNLEDLQKHTTLIPDDEFVEDLSCNQDFEFDVPKGSISIESAQTMPLEGSTKFVEDMLSLSNSLLTEAPLSPSSRSQFLPSLGEHVDIHSGEETLTRRLSSENEQLENAVNDLDKLENEEVLTSGNPASLVNPVSCDAAQVLPMLQNLLLQNETQRERVVGLMQLCDPTAANMNPIVNREGEQILTETDLMSAVHFLEQSVKKLEEEVENKKKENALLEEEINRIMRSSDP